jgi:hypothetical protein
MDEIMKSIFFAFTLAGLAVPGVFAAEPAPVGSNQMPRWRNPLARRTKSAGK